MTNTLKSIMRKMGIMAFFLPMMILLQSCTSSNNDDSPSDLLPSEDLNLRFTLVSPRMESVAVTSSQEGQGVDTRFYSFFNDGAKETVLAKQDGRYVNLGSFDVVKTSTYGEEGLLEVDANGKLDPTKPYDLYLLGGSARWDDGGVYYRTTLNRNGSFSTWKKMSSTALTSRVDQCIAGTCEILFVINKSGEPIRFKHKGFDAAEKWYYNYAEVSMDNGQVVASENGNEAISEVWSVPAFSGENATAIYSFYVASGKLINEAQLIAEINGQEVRSVNRISSDIQLQQNHSYAMFAVWDGEKLTMGDNENGQAVVHVCSGENSEDIQVIDVRDDGIIVISPSSTIKPQVGEIMVSGVTGVAPYGYLRKVESISEQGGQIIVRTSEASINEALPDFQGRFTLSNDQFVIQSIEDAEGNIIPVQATTRIGDFQGPEGKIAATVSYDFIKNKLTTGPLEGWDYKCAVSVDVAAKVNLDLDFIYDSHWGIVDRLGVEGTLGLDISSTAKFVSSIEREFDPITIYTCYLQPITVWAGIVPIVLTPQINLWMLNKCSGQFSISSKLFDFNKKWTVGLFYTHEINPENGSHFTYRYSSEPFSDLYSPSNIFKEIAPKFQLEGEWEAGFDVNANLGLYGSNDNLHLGVGLVPYAKLKGEFSYTCNKEGDYKDNIELRGGLKFVPDAKLEFKIPSWVKNIPGINGDKIGGVIKKDIRIFELQLIDAIAFTPSFSDFKLTTRKDVTVGGTSDDAVHVSVVMEKPSLQVFPDVDYGICYGTNDDSHDGRAETWTFISLKDKYDIMWDSFHQHQTLEADISLANLKPNTKYYVRPYVRLKLIGLIYRKGSSFTMEGSDVGGNLPDVPGHEL